MKLLGRHNEVVSVLLKRLDELAEHKDVPSVVVIEGASGTGKTAIIQEFYEQLKEARGDEYWPAQMAADAADVSSKGSPFATRKRVSPNLDNFVWPAGVLPQFGWFGFDCQRLSDGSTYDVISAARPQLRAHMLPLTLAGDEKLGRLRKLKKLVGLDTRDIYDAIVDEAEGVLTDAALEALGLVVPGLGLFTSLSKETAKKIKAAKQDKDALKGEVRTGDKNKEDRFVAATELAESICAVAQQSLPVIITIEDVHLMGEEMRHFLGRLEENRAWKELPILVVATAWPEGRKNSTYVEWLADEVGSQRAEVVSVPEFDLDSRRALLREYAPGTEGKVLDAIVAKLVTPFAIKLWVTQGKIQRIIRRNDEAIVLSADVSIPDSLKSLIRDRWNELDSDVQQALTFAVAVNPIDNDDTAEFIREIVARTSGNFDELSEAELLDAFVQAYKPINWCRFEDDLSSFTEPLLAQQARENSNEEFDVEDIRELYERASVVLAEWISANAYQGLMTPTKRNLNAARWFVASRDKLPAEISNELSKAKIIATATIALELAASYKFSRAIELLQEVMASPNAQVFSREMWRVRNNLAGWLSEVGRVGEAIERFEELLEDQRRVLGEDHPDTLRARNNLASLVGEVGRVGEAVEQFEALLEDYRRVLGKEHPDTLNTRNNLAFYLGEAGRFGEAIARYGELLEDQYRVLGAEHPDTLVTRSNLAYWLGKVGRVSDAIARYEVLLGDYLRVVGEHHPATLTIRNNLAFYLGEVGRFGEAIARYGELLEDQYRVLGADHPDTLRTRSNLASGLDKVGRVGEAIARYEELLEDQYRVLGADHPQTSSTRRNIASLIASVGRLEEAIARLGELLEEQRRILGEDHPETLKTRTALALVLSKAGCVDEAITLYKKLIADLFRVLGKDHPDTLAVWSNFASCLTETRRVDEAFVQYAGLIKEQGRVLGQNHPDTLRTWAGFAFCLATDGRLDKATDIYETLLRDYCRVLGKEHPDTLSVWNNFAGCLMKAGHTDEAVVQFKELHTVYCRVLGEMHPDTLTVNSALAFTLAQVGHFDEAIAQYEKLLAIQRQARGKDHPSTLVVWDNLAGCLMKAGRVDEAIKIFVGLFSKQRRVLGENHPETLRTRKILEHRFHAEDDDVK